MTCINPITNRPIKINGHTFNKLINDGYVVKKYVERNIEPLFSIFELNCLILNLLDDIDIMHLSMTNYKSKDFYCRHDYLLHRYRHLNISIITSYFYFRNMFCNKPFKHDNNTIIIYQVHHPWQPFKNIIKWNNIELPYIQYKGMSILYDNHIYHFKDDTKIIFI